METIDEHFVRAVRDRAPASLPSTTATDQSSMLQRLFDAQVQSRHLDFAARWLQKQGKGYYTIGSAGHESNAAVGLLSRATDPALLHYRSGGFYAARAAVAGTTNPVRDVLLSLTSATSDPMSGGRHKVIGHPDAHHHSADVDDRLPAAQGRRSRILPRPCPGGRTGTAVARGRARGVQFRRRVREPLDGRRRLQCGRLPDPSRHLLPGAVRLRGQRHRDQHADAERGGRRLHSRRLPGIPY